MADTGDTYNFAPLKNDRPLKSKLIRTQVIESGSLRSTLRLYSELDIPEFFDEKMNLRSIELHKTILITDISITSGAKRAEFTTRWENKSKDHLLQLRFLQGNSKAKENLSETFAENTFGIIKHEKHEFKPALNAKNFIPAIKGQEEKRYEFRTNTAPMQRFVWANGLGIITEGLSEYEVTGNSLFITILRSVGKLSKLTLNTRNFPAGPPLDTSGAQCLGSHTVKYSICATDNADELFKESDEFFGSIIADVGAGYQTKNVNFFKTNNKNIYTYAVKTPDNKNGVILRLMNLSGETQKVSFSTDLEFSGYAEVDGLEEVIDGSAAFAKTLVFTPYELKSVLFKKGNTND